MVFVFWWVWFRDSRELNFLRLNVLFMADSVCNRLNFFILLMSNQLTSLWIETCEFGWWGFWFCTFPINRAPLSVMYVFCSDWYRDTNTFGKISVIMYRHPSFEQRDSCLLMYSRLNTLNACYNVSLGDIFLSSIVDYEIFCWARGWWSLRYDLIVVFLVWSYGFEYFVSMSHMSGSVRFIGITVS